MQNAGRDVMIFSHKSATYIDVVHHFLSFGEAVVAFFSELSLQRPGSVTQNPRAVALSAVFGHTIVV